MNQSEDASKCASTADLGAYRLGTLIAPGGSSLVFAARREGLPFHGQWQVVLKCVWQVALARREAAHLVALNAVDGVVTLLDYREIAFKTIVQHCVAKDKTAPRTTDFQRLQEQYGLTAESPVGVLVLQYQAGAPLVCSTDLVTDPVHEDVSSLWVKDLESDCWLRQRLREDLSFDARLRLLQQLAAQVALCHRRGVVHGDLKPHNILLDSETSRVTLVDFGGDTSLTRGSPGWQAPEHFQVALGQRSSLPPATDVFVLGLFIHRLLVGRMPRRLRALVDRCFGPVDQRPTANAVASQLTAALAAQKGGWRSWFQNMAWTTVSVSASLLFLFVLVPLLDRNRVPQNEPLKKQWVHETRDKPLPASITADQQGLTRSVSEENSAQKPVAVAQKSGELPKPPTVSDGSMRTGVADQKVKHPGSYFLLPAVEARPSQKIRQGMGASDVDLFVTETSREVTRARHVRKKAEDVVVNNPLHDLTKQQLVLAVDSTLHQLEVAELTARVERKNQALDRLTLMNQQLQRQLADISNEASGSQPDPWFRFLGRPYDGFREQPLPSNWPPKQNVDHSPKKRQR